MENKEQITIVKSFIKQNLFIAMFIGLIMVFIITYSLVNKTYEEIKQDIIKYELYKNN